MKGYCENCKEVIDETEVYRFNKAIVCYNCFEKLTMIDYFLRLDFLRVDYNLTRKESRPYLCQICRLCETCQNNFDYECVETSDFLYRKGDRDDYKRVVKELDGIFVDEPKALMRIKKILSEGVKLKTGDTYRVKDKALDELEKLVRSKGYTLDDKDHNALRG